MVVVGGLSMLFMDEQHDHKPSSAVSAERAAEVVAEEIKETKITRNLQRDYECAKNQHHQVFKMPLHYPNYSKEDYEKMTEWQIDMLLKGYGLSVNGDLDYKKEFALNTFLWDLPSSDLHQDSTPHQELEKATNTITGILGFICSTLGFA